MQFYSIGLIIAVQNGEIQSWENMFGSELNWLQVCSGSN
jgi:hypothetical protein